MSGACILYHIGYVIGWDPSISPKLQRWVAQQNTDHILAVPVTKLWLRINGRIQWWNHIMLMTMLHTLGLYAVYGSNLICKGNLHARIPCIIWMQRNIHIPNEHQDKLFVEQFVLVHIKGNVKALHHLCFMKGIYQWLMDSPQKGQ